jgi:hypothetical protein
MMRQGDLAALRDAGIITDDKRAEIEAFLAQRAVPTGAGIKPVFDVTHVLWYGGALIVMAAMGLFTTDAFNRLGGLALAICGLVYFIALLFAGDYLWTKRNLRIPGGLLVAAAVSMVPMIVYGIQDHLDLWAYALGDPGRYRNFFPFVHGSWLYMEIATAVVAVLAAWRYKFSFILLVAGVALWFMSMDLAKWFIRGNEGTYINDLEIRSLVSIWFGLAIIAVAMAWDAYKGRNPDMMFWIHIFGTMAFWGGLSMQNSGSDLGKFLYLLVNLALIAFSLFIDRRIYTIFGAFGVAGYLGYLAMDAFKDLISFSFALSFIGIAIIALGIWISKHHASLSEKINASLPKFVQRLRPPDIR